LLFCAKDNKIFLSEILIDNLNLSFYMPIIHEHIRDVEFKCNLNIYNKMHCEYDRRRENIYLSKIKIG